MPTLDTIVVGVFAALVGACSFDTSTFSTAGALDGAPLVDSDARGSSPDSAPGAADADVLPGDPDAAGTAGPVCDKTLSELVLCMQFEEADGSTTLLDDSQYGNTATVANATFPMGEDGKALQGSGAFDSVIAKSASLDTDAELSIEAWLRPDADVTAGRQGIFDNNGQYGFFLVDGNRIRCSSSGGPNVTSSGAVISPLQWQHVACTYDGSTMNIYVDGAVVATTNGTGAISTTGTDGSALAQNSPDGDEYIGRIDTLRVWSVARSRQELCTGAGLSCP